MGEFCKIILNSGKPCNNIAVNGDFCEKHQLTDNEHLFLDTIEDFSAVAQQRGWQVHIVSMDREFLTFVRMKITQSAKNFGFPQGEVVTFAEIERVDDQIKWNLEDAVLFSKETQKLRKALETKLGSQNNEKTTTRVTESNMPGSKQCDVLIVCALISELRTVKKVLESGSSKWEEVKSDDDNTRTTHVYERLIYKTSNNDTLHIISTSAEAMGLTASAVACTQAIMLFKPKLVIMSGIAAGVDNIKQEFGDILIAHPSFNYSSGKLRTIEDGGFTPDYKEIPIDRSLEIAASRLSGDQAKLIEIRDNFNSDTPRAIPNVHIGPVGSADYVVDDYSQIEEILKHQRKLIGVEMETYAIYKSCQNSCINPQPYFISIKSICDFASKKTDQWQSYARHTSAYFTKYLLDSVKSLL